MWYYSRKTSEVVISEYILFCNLLVDDGIVVIERVFGGVAASWPPVTRRDRFFFFFF